jgi:uncharacterized protein YdeI (YjbR/CyaY-like superfamily)
MSVRSKIYLAELKDDTYVALRKVIDARKAAEKTTKGKRKMKISEETRKALEGVRTEIGANRTLTPKNEYNYGFNAGIEQAIKFLNNYLDGKGLFQ